MDLQAKLRVAVVECVGLMTHIIAKDKLEETMPRIIPGMMSLYAPFTPYDPITMPL